jgi:hypothetical protein
VKTLACSLVRAETAQHAMPRSIAAARGGAISDHDQLIPRGAWTWETCLASAASQWTLAFSALPLAYLAGGGGTSIPLSSNEQVQVGFAISLLLDRRRDVRPMFRAVFGYGRSR